MFHTQLFRRRQEDFRWKLREIKRQRWRAECLAATCPDCGERSFRICRVCHRWIRTKSTCCGGLAYLSCCNLIPKEEDLVRWIRLAAGIHLVPHPGVRRHDEDRWNAGPHGPRGCGPSLWENAVRA